MYIVQYLEGVQLYLEKLSKGISYFKMLQFTGVFSMNFIVFVDSTHKRILQVDIETGNIVKLPISRTNPAGIIFDQSKMQLLYSETSAKAIMSTTLHGKNTTLVYATGLHTMAFVISFGMHIV